MSFLDSALAHPSLRLSVILRNHLVVKSDSSIFFDDVVYLGRGSKKKEVRKSIVRFDNVAIKEGIVNKLFIVGSKLLGIYFLYLTVIFLPPAVSDVISTFSHRSVIEGLPISLRFSSVFSGVVMLVFAFALLFKTELLATKLNIQDDNQPNTQTGNHLQTGIVLIGIYIFCMKIGVLAQIFANNQRAKIRDLFAATQPQGLTFSSDYVAPCVTLIVSLLLIFGAKYISTFLRNEPKVRNSREEP